MKLFTVNIYFNRSQWPTWLVIEPISLVSVTKKVTAVALL